MAADPTSRSQCDAPKSNLDSCDATQLLEMVLDAIPLKIFWKDNDLRMRGCNQLFSADAGFKSPSDLIGLSDFDMPWTRSETEFFRACDQSIMDRDEAQIGIIESQTSASGEQSWVETSKIPLHSPSGDVIGILGVYHDVTEMKQSENALRKSHNELEQSNDELESRVLDRTRELQHMAQHDGLTGLANRGHFLRRLNDELDQENVDFALLFVDLDRFKTINDSLGHSAGDDLLIQVSNILQGAVRPGDLVGRFGGDEFTILIHKVRNIEEVLAISDRIQSTLKQSIVIDQCALVVTASIGIVVDSTDQYESADDVLRDADIAMYEAKESGKARYQLFSDEMLRKAKDRLELENEMRAGIHRDEFQLEYQPILDLRTGALTGFEALVRWQHPTRGKLSPNAFLTLAEESGLIVELGAVILRSVCRQFADWRDQLGEAVDDLSVNLNLSPVQMSCKDFPDLLEGAISEFRLAPRNIKIEITENSLLKDEGLYFDLFTQLRQRGYQLLLDDFGTGFCSLSYLHRFPIDTLKIDRSFIQSIHEDESSHAIVKTILALARVLDLVVVAEGVETEKQEQMLLAMGCDQVQGFHYSRPVAPEQAALSILESIQETARLDMDATTT